MGRRGLLVGAWALATLVATLVAWAAVRQVTNQVSPTSLLPVPAAVDVADLASEQPAGDQQAEEPEESEGPGTAPAVTEAYDLAGGVVTVRYRNGTARVVTATPNSGFDVDVNDGGPEKVDVRFRSDAHESRLVTRWRNGSPDPERDERPR